MQLAAKRPERKYFLILIFFVQLHSWHAMLACTNCFRVGSYVKTPFQVECTSRRVQKDQTQVELVSQTLWSTGGAQAASTASFSKLRRFSAHTTKVCFPCPLPGSQASRQTSIQHTSENGASHESKKQQRRKSIHGMKLAQGKSPGDWETGEVQSSWRFCLRLEQEITKYKRKSGQDVWNQQQSVWRCPSLIVLGKIMELKLFLATCQLRTFQKSWVIPWVEINGKTYDSMKTSEVNSFPANSTKKMNFPLQQLVSPKFGQKLNPQRLIL